MFAAAKQRYTASMEQVTSWDDFMQALNNKHMVLAPWADEVAVSGIGRSYTPVQCCCTSVSSGG